MVVISAVSVGIAVDIAVGAIKQWGRCIVLNIATSTEGIHGLCKVIETTLELPYKPPRSKD